MPPDITDNLSSPDDNGSDEMLIQQLGENNAVMLSLEDELRDLNVAEESLNETGVVSKEAIANIIKLCPRFKTHPYAPLQSYTELPSKTNLKATLEAVNKAERDNVSKALLLLVNSLKTMKNVKEEFFSVRTPSPDTIGRERTNKRIELMNQISEALNATVTGGVPGEEKSEHPLVTGARIRYNDYMTDILKSQGNAFVLGYISRSPESNSFEVMDNLRNDLVVGAVALRGRLDMLRNGLETLPVLFSERFAPMVRDAVQYRTVRRLTENRWKGIGPASNDYTFVQGSLVSYDKTVIDNAEIVEGNKFGTNADIVDLVCKLDFSYDNALENKLDILSRDAREIYEAIIDRCDDEKNDDPRSDPTSQKLDRLDLNIEGDENVVFNGIYVLFNEIMVYCQLRQMYQIGMTKVFRFCDRIIEGYYAPIYDRQWLGSAVSLSPAVKSMIEKAREDDDIFRYE